MIFKNIHIMKNTLRNFQKYCNYKFATKNYISYYKQIIESNPALARPVEGENEWLKHWRTYDKNLSPLCYRIFSRYVNKDCDIIPLEYISSIIEPILTPLKYLSYYSDKNNFNKLLPNHFMPKVLLMNIDRLMFDGDYNLIDRDKIDTYLRDIQNKYNILILKPSRLASGNGVQILKKDNAGNLVNNRGKQLSASMLKEDYNANYLIQECVEQSEFMSQFNPSSVNTIRIATYRDLNGKVHYLSAGMRIGAKGSNVDNAHAGGKFCGISQDGKIGHYVCDWLGFKQSEHNGLYFNNNDWVIPDYEVIKQFAINVSERIIHHDLVALDIALNKDGKPILIEFNVGGFGAWFFLMGGQSIFGGMENQIMQRCYKAYQQLEFYIWQPIHKNHCLRGL